MIFRNKVKYNMYKFLTLLEKNHDYNKTYQELSSKIDDYSLNFAIYECINKGYIDGVIYSKGKLNNQISLIASKNVYVTYYGYVFIKQYHATAKKIIWHLFLMAATAIITVEINNLLSLPKQTSNPECYCNTNE